MTQAPFGLESRGAKARLLALGLLALALLAVVMLGVLPLRAWERRLAAEIDLRQGQLAAQAEIAKRRSELGRALAELRDPAAVEGLLLGGNSDAAATAALHERARELIAASQAILASVQPLPTTEDASYRKIAVRLQLAADLAGFQRILHALESGRPVVSVTNLQLRARSARTNPGLNPLDVQLDLIGFRKSGGGA